MNFTVIETNNLQDGTERFLLQVPSEELVYLGYILEAYEGWCNYTTPKRKEPYLQVDVAPDYIADFQILLAFLKEWKL